jgi:cyclase
VRTRLAKNQTFWIPPYTQEALPTHALPNVTFSDSLTIYKSNGIIQVYHLKNAHTDVDVYVRFKKANVIHTGDLVMTFGLPFIDGHNGV